MKIKAFQVVKYAMAINLAILLTPLLIDMFRVKELAEKEYEKVGNILSQTALEIQLYINLSIAIFINLLGLLAVWREYFALLIVYALCESITAMWSFFDLDDALAWTFTVFKWTVVILSIAFACLVRRSVGRVDEDLGLIST